MDETSRKDVYMTGKTISRRGTRSVWVMIQRNTKRCISAICIGWKSGNKFRPLYILKESHHRVRDTLEPALPRARVTLSANGWMNEPVMMKYWSWSKIAMSHMACALMLYSYPAHMAPRVGDKAAQLEIEIILVPRGLSGECQPLDCPCFSLFKKKSQRFWDENARKLELKWTHEQGAKLPEDSLSLLTGETIEDRWKLTADTDSPSIPETDRSVNESSGSDERHQEPEFGIRTRRT
jgi:hypothetical protein